MSTTTTPRPEADVEPATGDEGSIAPGPRLAPPTHTALEGTDLQRRTAVAVVLSLAVVVLALGPWDGPAIPWVQWLLATPVIGWAAWPLHRAAVLAARRRSTTTDTLSSLGVVLAWLWSTVTLLTGAGAEATYFFAPAAVVTACLLVGRWVEARAMDAARADLDELTGLGADGVAVQRIDSRTRATTEVLLQLGDLRVGDHFIVRPGERVATDGVVVDGTSSIDTSLLTGSTVPLDVRSGDHVDAGTVNTSGRLVVEVTALGADTTHAEIVRHVERAQTGSSDAQRLADRVASALVPAVLGLAVLAFFGWWVGSGSTVTALGVAVAVLVIACPLALALATPAAVLVGTTRGAQRGILVAGPHVLDGVGRIDTLVLDKTGTITTGDAQVTDLAAAPGLHPAAVLTAAAAVESGSDHPIARAIVRRAQDQGIKIPVVRDFEALPGSGAVASIKDTRVTVGRADLFDEVPAELATLERPGTTVFVGWGGTARGALTVADPVRDSSGDALRSLRAAGLEIWLVSGDNAHNATEIAAKVGIEPEHVIADVRPQDKHDEIARLQEAGRVVAVVGDGSHDGTAIERADLGLALGTGAPVAADSADIVLVHGDLESVPRAVALTRRTHTVSRHNVLFAIGYNVVALLLALTGLVPPVVAGALTAVASVAVVLSSLRLRRAAD